MKRYNNKKSTENKGFIDIYGFHAVKAALKNSRRKHLKLVVSESRKDFLTPKIKESVNEIMNLNNKEMLKLYGNENNHQGLILTTSNLIQPSIQEIIKEAAKKEIEVVIMLDHVNDPQNIGSIMRTCSLFNCSTIIVTKNHSPNITSTIAKAASGALEIVNFVKVANLCQTIKIFKKNNFWVFGLDGKNNVSKNLEDLPKKCLFVFGAEGKGLREKTSDECDDLISIPINLKNNFNIDSLNVSNACSIILYEHFKKYK